MTAKKLSKFHSRLLKNIENGSFSRLSRAEQHKLTSRVDKLKERYNSYLHILQKGVAAGAIAAAFLVTLPSYAQIDLEQQLGIDNPLDTLTLSDYTAPQLVDIDGDNDLDLFVGIGDGDIQYFKNIGSITEPVFERQEYANNPLSEAQEESYINLTFADIDNDGDLDVLVSHSSYDSYEYYGHVNEYQNNGDANNPNFVQAYSDTALFDGVEFDPYSQASYADVDSDGDYDVVISTGNGDILYYENIGTKDSIALEQKIEEHNPFGNIAEGFGDYSEPKLAFIDFDGDNDLDVFITPDVDSTLLYENTTDGPGVPVFVYNEVDNTLKDSTIGDFPVPAFGDLNNDGVPDLIIGNGYGLQTDGELLYFESQPVTTGLVVTESFEMTLFPNPVINTASISSEKVIESLNIHSTTGVLILALTPNSGSVELDLSEFNEGTYIVSLIAADGSTSSQVITKD